MERTAVDLANRASGQRRPLYPAQRGTTQQSAPEVPTLCAVTELRLTHPALDFYVDVTLYERDGRYMAAADLAEGSRDIGVGDTPREAVRAALAVLGEPYASEMAEGVKPEPG